MVRIFLLIYNFDFEPNKTYKVILNIADLC